MEFIDLIFSLFENQDFLFKIALIILTSFYGLFALIVNIQIFNLNRILNQITFSPVFKILGVAHFIAALALIALTVLFL